ncbi:MAG: serine/threonine protein kinase [Myxococcales bacterium]|nr:serine/threonine protein kinase [Myxococcales bacterium]
MNGESGDAAAARGPPTNADETRVLPGRERDVEETRVDQSRDRDAVDEARVTLATRVDAQAPREARAPARIGRYLIIETLGKGGMGVVYAAYDPELNRKVAIKVLRGQAGQDARARLRREAQAMAQLSHPNVVRVYDVGIEGDEVFVAMDLVEGQDLRHWVRRERPGWQALVDVFVEAGRGLAAAHAVGIVHRDFKPDNVLIGEARGASPRRVQVADFGLAKLGGAPAEDPPQREELLRTHESLLVTPLTRADAIVGTPAYMSPEQFHGSAPDHLSDQYAFCVALWETLFRERPFAGVSMRALKNNIVLGVRRPPPAGSKVPRWLLRLCDRGLAKDPRERFASMDALLAEIARHRRRPRWHWAALALGFAGLGALALWAVAPPPQAPAITPCRDGEAQLVGVWDDATRTAGAEGFAATKLVYADDVWRGAARRLDAYRDAWLAGYVDACEATRVRAVQSQELLDRRVGCLSRARLQLGALAGMFARADEPVVKRAIDAVEALPDLERCADTLALQTAVAPPDAALRERLASVEERLAELRGLLLARKYKDALALAEPLQAEAAALEYPPINISARHVLADAQAGAGALEQASAQLEAALWEALASGHDEPVLDLLIRLVGFEGEERARLDRARLWGDHADAVLKRRGEPALARARWLGVRGIVEIKAGDHDVARAMLEEAIRLRVASSGEDSHVANLYNSLGAVELRTGHYDAAERLFSRALALRQESCGALHPDLINPLNNLALALERQGKYDEAVAALDRCLALLAATSGEDHPNYGLVLGNRGFMVHLAGRDDEAAPGMERGVAILEAALGPEHPALANPIALLAEFRIEAGDVDAAAPLFQRAYDLRVAAFGVDHPGLALPIAGLARVKLARGQRAGVVDELRRALELIKAEPDPGDVAVIQFTLAEALWTSGARDEAVLRAREALAAALEAGANSAKRRAAIETWLFEHTKSSGPATGGAE